jgi:hypothetical protein
VTRVSSIITKLKRPVQFNIENSRQNSPQLLKVERLAAVGRGQRPVNAVRLVELHKVLSMEVDTTNAEFDSVH